MGADGARASTDGEWSVDSQIDPTLFRVRRGEQTRWFAVVDSDAVGESESRVWPHVRGACVAGRAGLLVARCEGGLLEDALRRRGGMSAVLALGVLDEVLEVLETAPAPPDRGSRAAIRSFAVERSGGVALVPGRFREGVKRSDAAELGELLHLALTGATWEETGLPLSETAPEVPAAVSSLVTDLLEGTVLAGGARERADIADLRARVGRMGPSRERGFLPAEPGVLEEDAPTGTLSPELVVALRTSPTSGSRTSDSRATGSRAFRSRVHAPPSRERQSSGVQTRKAGAARTRRDRRRVERGRRHGRMSIGILLACAASVAVGAVLMSTGVGTGTGTEADAGDEVAGPEASQRTPVAPPDPMPAPPSAHSLSPSAAAKETPDPSDPSRAPEAFGTQTSGPREAAVELTRARAEAFAVGDADALAAVTVPGSPAAEADEERTLGECDGCADALSLSDVGIVRDPGAPATSGEQHYEDGRPTEEGQQAHVRAMMRSAGAAPIPVVFVLEWNDDQWRVHEVRPS